MHARKFHQSSDKWGQGGDTCLAESYVTPRLRWVRAQSHYFVVLVRWLSGASYNICVTSRVLNVSPASSDSLFTAQLEFGRKLDPRRLEATLELSIRARGNLQKNFFSTLAVPRCVKPRRRMKIEVTIFFFFHIVRLPIIRRSRRSHDRGDFLFLLHIAARLIARRKLAHGDGKVHAALGIKNPESKKYSLRLCISKLKRMQNTSS